MRLRACAALLSVAIPIFGLGCQSQVDSGRAAGSKPAGTNGPGQDTGIPGTGGGPGNTVTPPTDDPRVVISDPNGACAPDTDPGRVTIRRLTAPQYDHTVRDLLGDTTAPGEGFPNDDAFLAETMTVGPLLFEKYEAAAEALINEAWTREEAASQPAGTKLWVCTPSEGDADCARQMVRSFARKAFRRPVADAELAPYLGILDTQEGTLADRTKAALSGLLISPNFVYRVELDPDPRSLTPHGLTVHELAARLSYTVWGSMPDAALFARADSGELASVAAIKSELARMMSDPKAHVLTDEFAMKWLSLTEISKLTRDNVLYPDATPELFGAMQQESREFLRSFFEGSTPLVGLLTADFTYGNQLLAEHYGLDASGLGSDLQRLNVPPGPRRGLLGQGSILSLTAKPDKTSAVKRGKWVASRLLCAEPPPPPDGMIPESPAAEMASTERERLAIHRANPVCASCHTLIDPIGLGLENFDSVGRYRTEVNGITVDASGQLPNGQMFNGAAELNAILATDPLFHACVGDHIATYTLGRNLTSKDKCLHDSMGSVVGSGATVAQLLEVLVTSPAFTARRGE